MGTYKITSILEDKYPKLLQAIKCTYKYYTIPESINTILKGSRDYDGAHRIMNSLLNIFIKEKEYASIQTEYKGDFGIIYDSSLNIYDVLFKTTGFDTKLPSFHNSVGIEQKLKNYANILDEVLKGKRKPNLSDYKEKNNSYNNYESELKYYITELFFFMELYYKLLLLFTDIFDIHNNFNIKPYNHKRVIVAEFFMFFSHLVFAFLNEQEANDSNKKSYVINNVKRAVNHLERGALDIVKIIVCSVFNSFKPTDNIVQQKIIDIRVDELMSLSMSMKNRIMSYIKWLQEQDELYKNKKIQQDIMSLVSFLS